LVGCKKTEISKKDLERASLYDMNTPNVRRGIAGWKLTKRPIASGDNSKSQEKAKKKKRNKMNGKSLAMNNSNIAET